MTYNVLIGTLNPTHSLIVISANVSILFVGSVMVNKVLSFSHRSCSHRLKLLQPVEYSIVVVVVYFNVAVVQPNSVKDVSKSTRPACASHLAGVLHAIAARPEDGIIFLFSPKRDVVNVAILPLPVLLSQGDAFYLARCAVTGDVGIMRHINAMEHAICNKFLSAQ